MHQSAPNCTAGRILTPKQEAGALALAKGLTCERAAEDAGVSLRTIKSWNTIPEFRRRIAALRAEMTQEALGLLSRSAAAAARKIVTLMHKSENERVQLRAAVSLLDHALRGVSDGGVLHTEWETVEEAPMDTGDVVQTLSVRLRQLDAAELPTGEKSRLTATLADALLRAIGVNVLDQRLEALQAVLKSRKEEGR
jgi:hypothetical protein